MPPARASVTISCSSRDLPMPGSPRITTQRAAPPALQARSAACAWRSSSSRPISGAAGGSSTSRSTRHGCSAAALPRTVLGGSRSPSKCADTMRQVSSPTTMSPASASFSSRAAVLTASPVSPCRPWCGAQGCTTTRPLWMPLCRSMCTPSRGAWRVASSRTARCSSSAARRARSASSRPACGMPNSAMISSPTNWLTMPPWASTTRVASARSSVISAPTSSGSTRSFSAV